ncbi:MAG: DUF2142 domain-containing protein [Nakamurella sp.]
MATSVSEGAEHVTDPPPEPGSRSPQSRVRSLVSQAHWMFLIIGGVFLAGFIALIPPGFGLDEQTHFYRAYQISEGTLFPSLDPVAGTFNYAVPRSLYDLQQQGWSDGNSIDRNAPSYQRHDMGLRSRYAELLGASVNPGDRVDADITQTLANIPVVYTAPAAAMALTRALGGDVGLIEYAAKVANGLVYLAFGFIAVWYARRLRFRWLVLVTALLPAAIFQASVISADTFTNGACLMFVSIAITLLLERTRIGAGSLALLAVAAGAIALSKPTYALLVILVLFLPAEVFPSRRWGRWYKAALLTGSLLLLAWNVYLGQKGSIGVFKQVPGAAGQVNAADQLIFVLTHPIEGLIVLAHTVEVFGTSWVQGVVGLFGYNTVPVPPPFSVLTVLVVVAAGFYSESLRRLAGWAVLLVGCLVALALIGIFYLTFSAVAAPYANGIQGRYFIPCVVAVTVGVASVLPMRLIMRQGTANAFFTALPAVTLAASLVMYFLFLY